MGTPTRVLIGLCSVGLLLVIVIACVTFFLVVLQVLDSNEFTVMIAGGYAVVGVGLAAGVFAVFAIVGLIAAGLLKLADQYPREKDRNPSV